MKYIHDPDCAVIRDVAFSANDAKEHPPPPCTCKERQKARVRTTIRSIGAGYGGAGHIEGHNMGNGNYWKGYRGMSEY